MSGKDRRKQVLAKQARDRLDDTLKNRVVVDDVVAYDLGMGTCGIAVNRNGTAEVLKGPEGPLMKSAVYRDKSNNQEIVGDLAYRMAVKNPANFYSNFKTRMELNADTTLSSDGEFTTIDAMAALLRKLKELTVKLHPRVGRYPQFGGGQYRPEKLRVVITIPAGWGLEVKDKYLKALVKAGFPEELLDTIVFIREPHAAVASALNGLEGVCNSDQIMVVDIGAGTSDIIVLRMRDGVLDTAAPESGIADLGGSNLTAALADLIGTKVRHKFKAYSRKDGLRLNRASIKEADRLDQLRIWLAAEDAKHQLFSSDTAIVNCEFRKGIRDCTISRDEALEKWKPEFAELEAAIRRTTVDAGISWAEVKHIVLAGGAARTPGIQELVANATERAIDDIAMSDEPQLGIATGACILALKLEDVATATNNGFGLTSVHRDSGEIVRELFIKKGAMSPVGGIVVERYSHVIQTRGGRQTIRLEPFITKPGIVANEEGALLKDTEIIRLKPVEATVDLPPGEHRVRTRIIYDVAGRAMCVIGFPELEGIDSYAVSLHVDDGKSKTAAAPKDIIVLFDRSSSMYEEPIEEARRATKDFVAEMIGVGCRVAVVAFGRTVDTEVPWTTDVNVACSGIDGIQAEGGTPMAQAIRIAKEMIGENSNVACAMFSDGHATDDGVVDAAEEFRDLAEFFTIAIGENADEKTLAEIATSRSHFLPVGRAADLPKAFEQICSLLYTGETVEADDLCRDDEPSEGTAECPSDIDEDDENAGDWEEVA